MQVIDIYANIDNYYHSNVMIKNFLFPQRTHEKITVFQVDTWPTCIELNIFCHFMLVKTHLLNRMISFS